jgi:hypothetical protein
MTGKMGGGLGARRRWTARPRSTADGSAQTERIAIFTQSRRRAKKYDAGPKAGVATMFAALSVADQAAATWRRRRPTATAPRPAKPMPIIAQVEGSGTDNNNTLPP